LARQSKKEARAARRRQEAAIKMLVLGGALALMPLFIGKTPIGKGLASLMPLGLLLLGIGAALLWLSRRSSVATAPTSASMPTTQEHRTALPRTAPTARIEPSFTEAERATPTEDKGFASPGCRPASWSKEVLDVIEWRRLEAVVEGLFQQAGFQTKSQSHGPDGGVDVWLYSRNHSAEPVSLVQCKHWNERTSHMACESPS
jgi:restriction system protein